MTDLSPAARAVWEAFRQFDEAGMHVDYDVKIAAALRAAADQVLTEEARPEPGNVQPGGTRMYYHERLGRWEERQQARRDFLAIAAELEKGAP